MSFIVSNSFNSHETIVMLQLIKLFQQPMLPTAETNLNKCMGVACSTVSVVSLLIHLLNEIRKSFNRLSESLYSYGCWYTRFYKYTSVHLKYTCVLIGWFAQVAV